MNKVNIFFISILFSFVFIFCNSEITEQPSITPQVIKVDLDKKAIPNIKIKKIIPLESKEEAIFGRATRIQYYQDKIYLLDYRSSKTLLLFNSDGKFIKKIPIGKGAGECVQIKDFYIDEKEEKILVWDHRLKRMSEFDLNLNHLNSKNIDVIIRQFEKLESGDWLVNRGERILSNGQDYQYYVHSQNFDSIKFSLLPIERQMVKFTSENPISRGSNYDILFTKQYDQNIYALGENSVEIKYVLDFAKYNFQKEDILNNGYRYPAKLAREGKRVIGIDPLINSIDYIGFKIVFKKREYIIYSKRDNLSWFSGSLVKEGLLPQGRLMCLENNNFLIICEPDHFKNFCKKNGNLPVPCDDIDANDNSVLISFEILPK